LTHTIERYAARIAQIIDNYDSITALKQFHNCMAADEAGSTGHEDTAIFGGFHETPIRHDDLLGYVAQASFLWLGLTVC
jgi:hypothetical protein